MKNIITIFTVISLLAILFFIYVFYSSWKYKESGAITTSDSFYLNNKQVEQFKKMALNGDEGASYELTYYYDIYEHNPKEAEKWLKFAIKHNHLWALETYGHRLCHEGKQQEGIEYLTKACKIGAKNACAKVAACKSK